MLLAPLLPLPEAAPLGINAAHAADAVAEVRAASPDVLSSAAADEPSTSARCLTGQIICYVKLVLTLRGHAWVVSFEQGYFHYHLPA